MRLHRIIPIVPFVADPLWSETQVAPPTRNLTIGTSFVDPIDVPGTGQRIYWVAIAKSSATATAVPIVATGWTLDARMVYGIGPAVPPGLQPAPIVVGRQSLVELSGLALPIGREAIEYAPYAGSTVVLQAIAFAGAPAAGACLWIYAKAQQVEG